MTKVRVIIEYLDAGGESPTMRWERVADSREASAESLEQNGATGTVACELLGRAFEVVQREEGAAFQHSLAAFFRGALVQKQDVADVLLTLDD